MRCVVIVEDFSTSSNSSTTCLLPSALDDNATEPCTTLSPNLNYVLILECINRQLKLKPVDCQPL